MRSSSLRPLLVVAIHLLPWTTSAQLTLTRTNYLCSVPSISPSLSIAAVSSSSSATSRSSSATLDAALSSGSPFNIIVSATASASASSSTSTSAALKRAAPPARKRTTTLYLTTSGALTASPGDAATFALQGTTLYAWAAPDAADVLLYATWPVVPNQTFAGYAPDSVGPIDGAFGAAGGALTWVAPGFEGPGGGAQWFVKPGGDGEEADGVVVVWFFGPVAEDWVPVGLEANCKLFCWLWARWAGRVNVRREWIADAWL